MQTITITRSRIANVFLLCLVLSYIMMFGGGCYEQMNVTHVVVNAPPKSLSMLQGPFGFTPLRFWITFRPITMVLFIITLILNWDSRERRKFLIVAFCMDIIITVATFLYFAPETAIITQSVPFDTNTVDHDLQILAQRWSNLNVLRLIAFFSVSVLLLLTLQRTDDLRSAQIT